MSAVMLAEFAEAAPLLEAARRATRENFTLLDVFSPFPVEGIAELLGCTSTALRVYMFAGGMAVAALAYGIEAWSAVWDYPIDSGGRPLNSWPAFMLFPFAIGIFGAALTGFVGLLLQTGLPSLHHRLFDIPGFERATQDRFMLALHPPADASGKMQMIEWLRDAGAERVWEVEP